MSTKGEQVRNKAVELIKANPEGLRFAELQRQLQRHFPGTSKNTIDGASWNIHVTRPKDIYKPSKGLFKAKTADEAPSDAESKPTSPPVREEDLYAPFAAWLKSELGECSEAVALGGNQLRGKWGTPDVIGVYKPSRRDVVQFQSEIISAEVKINPSDPVTAFGQAITYRLFSSKVYLVEPATLSPEDLDRIDALCILFGIGFVLFDPNPQTPNFRIRVRAQRHSPDMFYVNSFAARLDDVNKRVFEKLF